MEWVEVRGSSVDVAVEAALVELGLSSRDEANIEVMEEPTKGFLGMGGREALVRVTAKPKTNKRSRRRRRGGGGGESRQPKERQGGDRAGREQRQKKREPRKAEGRGDGKDRRPARTGGAGDGRSKQGAKERAMDDTTTPEVEIDTEGQAAVVAEFLSGLLESFGLEGTVTTQVDDELILADVTGEQTEALIGAKGSIMQSVGELTRTVVQRKTHRRARLRLDIGGYQERRREALRIYTGRLAEQVLADGGEIMLEPMNPADRKTVHDAVLDIDGVRSFSEGEEPNRSVVIALAPGVTPTGPSQPQDAEPDDDGAGEDDSDE